MVGYALVYQNERENAFFPSRFDLCDVRERFHPEIVGFDFGRYSLPKLSCLYHLRTLFCIYDARLFRVAMRSALRAPPVLWPSPVVYLAGCSPEGKRFVAYRPRRNFARAQCSHLGVREDGHTCKSSHSCDL